MGHCPISKVDGDRLANRERAPCRSVGYGPQSCEFSVCSNRTGFSSFGHSQKHLNSICFVYSDRLNPEQTAPYVALCGCTVTIASERSSYCGQSGRVCRIFWRPEPWVLVRLRSGVLLALPWSWTNLPKPEAPSSSGRAPALLSPAALRDLVRFLRSREEQRRGSREL